MPEVSVIVPVYNVERYLARCIESILAQTLKDFELILIDDGSADKSGKICNEYATRDARISVIHQANAGVSAARNAGIKAATGQWICFVDSDDWIDASYLETLLSAAKSSEQAVELVLSGVKSVENNKVVDETKFAPTTFNEKNFSTIFSDFKIYYYAAPHGKLYSKQPIAEHNIRFNPKIKYGEDLFFLLDFLTVSHNVEVIGDCLYNYNIDVPSSLSKEVNSLDTEHEGHIVSKKYGELFARYGTKQELGLDLLEVGSLRRMIRAIYKDYDKSSDRIAEFKKLDVALLKPSKMAEGVWKLRLLDLLLINRCWKIYDFLITKIIK